MADHHNVDLRSLALDRAVAARLRSDPRLINQAQANLTRWLATCSPAVRPVLEEWRRQLDAPIDETLALLVATDERAARLRQSSPFAGILPAAERTAILGSSVNRGQLEPIIRAAAGNADARDIVVIGSQSILGTYPDAPAELTRSIEADVYPRDRPEDAILIDGAIGERSIFHATFGYYAHGVGEDTAVLPEGWRKRLVRVENENTRGAVGWCLEVHDLAVSKLVAGRDKDLEFVGGLLKNGLADSALVRERIGTTPLSTAGVDLVLARLSRLAGM